MWDERRYSLRLSSLLVILITGLALLGCAVPQVKAAGVVYIGPSSQPVQQTGTNVTFAIMVTGMDHFKSWDIYVRVDPNILEPESINNTSAILTVLTTTLADCVNGVGLGCTSSDGPGIAHSALVSSWPPPIDSPWQGQLFTVTFKVKNAPGAFIQPFNDTIIDSATNLPVTHTTVPGVYGQPGQFEFSQAPFLIVPLSGTNQTLVTVNSLNGFSGMVSLTATVPSLASYFLNVSLQPAQVRLDPATPATFSVVVSSAISRGSYPGSYTVNIVGTSGAAYNSTSISVVVPEVYLLYEMQYPLQAGQGEKISLQNTFQNEGELPIRIVSVTLTSDFGTFTLFSAHAGGPTLCGLGYTGTIDVINGQNSRSLNLTIPQNAHPGNHTFTVTVGWQYQGTIVIYNNPVNLWCDTQPLVLQRSMIVMESSPSNPGPTPNPSGLAGSTSSAISALIGLIMRNWPYVLGAYFAVATLAVMIVVVKRPRKVL